MEYLEISLSGSKASYWKVRKKWCLMDPTGNELMSLAEYSNGVHGPILFTIYINNLPDIVQNVAKLFADDTKLYATVINTNDERKLQGDIDRLMQWSKDWLLTFNKSKCKHVHFSPPNNAKYQMGGDYQHLIHRRERPWYHYIR